MECDVVTQAWRIGLRSLQMLRAGLVATGVFVHQWLTRRRLEPGAAQRAAGRALVRLCTNLGATFIKVGQIASTRGDLLPQLLIQELATLQDRVPPFPFAAVRRAIATDLGVSLESLFSRFEAEPVAAASVAQVHRAVLRATGDCVAVKVRRPDVLEKVQLDRSILLFVSRALERLIPSFRLMSLEDAMRNFCNAVEEQIHLTNEARNNQRFTRNFAGDPDIHFPRLFPAACADSVLTMEFVEGVREADLDAGGVFLLDLGLVGELTDADRLGFAELLFAFASGDGPTTARLFAANAPVGSIPDYAAYEAEIVAVVDHVRRQGLGKLQITLEIGRIFDMLRRHHIQARGHMTMINLALMTAEGLGKRLDPQVSLADEALPYLAEALGVDVAELPRAGAARMGAL